MITAHDIMKDMAVSVYCLNNQIQESELTEEQKTDIYLDYINEKKKGDIKVKITYVPISNDLA